VGVLGFVGVLGLPVLVGLVVEVDPLGFEGLPGLEPVLLISAKGLMGWKFLEPADADNFFFAVVKGLDDFPDGFFADAVGAFPMLLNGGIGYRRPPVWRLLGPPLDALFRPAMAEEPACLICAPPVFRAAPTLWLLLPPWRPPCALGFAVD
jgi:hypothetical protein